MVRQLEMLHETRSLDVIGMVEDEFGILRRRGDILAEILGAQCAVDQRHRHRLALGITEGEAVAAGEFRRFGLRAAELVDHLAFGDGDFADVDGEAERSEEQTYELQSLMRISYAVFCLKKKKIQKIML